MNRKFIYKRHTFNQSVKMNTSVRKEGTYHTLVTNDMGATNFYRTDLVTEENIKEYIFKHEEEARNYIDKLYYSKLSDFEKMLHGLGFRENDD